MGHCRCWRRRLALGTISPGSAPRCTLTTRWMRPVGSGFVLQPTGAQFLRPWGFSIRLPHAGDASTGWSTAEGRRQACARRALPVRRIRDRCPAGGAVRHLVRGGARSRVAFEASARISGIEPGLVLVSSSRMVRVHRRQTSSSMPWGQFPDRQPADSELSYGALWATVPFPDGGPFPGEPARTTI